MSAGTAPPGSQDGQGGARPPRVVWDPRMGQVLVEMAHPAVLGDFIGDVLPHQVELVEPALPRQQAARLHREIADQHLTILTLENNTDYLRDDLEEAREQRDEARARIAAALAYLAGCESDDDTAFTTVEVRRLLSGDQS